MCYKCNHKLHVLIIFGKGSLEIIRRLEHMLGLCDGISGFIRRGRVT